MGSTATKFRLSLICPLVTGREVFVQLEESPRGHRRETSAWLESRPGAAALRQGGWTWPRAEPAPMSPMFDVGHHNGAQTLYLAEKVLEPLAIPVKTMAGFDLVEAGARLRLFAGGMATVCADFRVETQSLPTADGFRRGVVEATRGTFMIEHFAERVLPAIREFNAATGIDAEPGLRFMWAHKLLACEFEDASSVEAASNGAFATSLFASRQTGGGATVTSPGMVVLPGRATSVALHVPDASIRSVKKAIEYHDAAWSLIWNNAETLSDLLTDPERENMKGSIEHLDRAAALYDTAARNAERIHASINDTRILLRPFEKRIWDAQKESTDFSEVEEIHSERISAVRAAESYSSKRVDALRRSKIGLALAVLAVLSFSQTLIAAIAFGHECERQAHRRQAERAPGSGRGRADKTDPLAWYVVRSIRTHATSVNAAQR